MLLMCIVHVCYLYSVILGLIFIFFYFSESPAITEKNVDDILFDMFKNSDETVPVGKFLAVSKKYLEIF